jgi:hypothetical protein
LELYHIDNGFYPGQQYTNALYRTSQNGSIAFQGFANSLEFPDVLSKYIMSIPKPKIPGGTALTNALFYFPYNPSNSNQRKCAGSNNFPPYVIYLPNSATTGFEDLPMMETWTSILPNQPSSTAGKCISLR